MGAAAATGSSRSSASSSDESRDVTLGSGGIDAVVTNAYTTGSIASPHQAAGARCDCDSHFGPGASGFSAK